MTLLQCINRILRMNTIIRGDTDEVQTLSDTQHNASLNLAIVATQNELIRLTSDRLIPSERQTSGTITLVASQRTYTLASDFTRFYGDEHFYVSSGNQYMTQWVGGLPALQAQIYTYATDTGDPNWWYWEPTSTKKVGLFQVPNASGAVWTYEYEGSVFVDEAADTLPFHNDEESYMFTEMAARRFKYLWEDIKNELDIQAVLEKDLTYKSSKAALLNLIKGQNPTRRYGSRYY